MMQKFGAVWLRCGSDADVTGCDVMVAQGENSNPEYTVTRLQ